MQATYACQSLPLVNGDTVSEYHGLIRLPATFGVPTCCFGSAYLDASQEWSGPPKPALNLSKGRGSFVLRASHPTVTSDARLGRACPERSEGLLLAEHQVVSLFRVQQLHKQPRVAPCAG